LEPSGPGAAPARTSPRWPYGLAQAALVLLAFYRGFRAPSMWSINYYQISWADGFLRRGLLGTLLLPLGCARFDPHVVWVIQYSVLAAALVLLFRLGRNGVAAALALCVFMVSDAGTFFFNEVGYPDQILMLVTVGCGALLARDRAWAAALLMAVAALIHEMALFTVLPVVLVLWLRLPAGRRPALWKLLLPMFLVLAALPLFSTSIPFAVLKRYDDLSIACGHPIGRRDFLLYYAEPFGQEFQFYYHGVELARVVLPLMAALALWILSGAAFPSASRPERWAALLACCCPLLLGYLGTDKNRWVMLVLVQALLLLGIARPKHAPPPRARLSPFKKFILALPLLMVLLMLRIRLFDHFTARPLSVAGIEGFGPTVAGQLDHLPVQ
jgi:hypothetical protein